MNDAATKLTALLSQRQPEAVPDPLPLVRQTVRSLLLSSPAFRELNIEQKKLMAEAMVKVCHAAAAMIREEVKSDEQVAGALSSEETNGGLIDETEYNPDAEPLASAQGFGDAADRIAGTTRNVLNAVSFPRFVTELINGVFKAIVDSSQQQMQGYVELLNNVAASLDGFAGANYGPDRARQWLVERYPGAFEVIGETRENNRREESSGDEWETDSDEESRGGLTLRLRSGASMPPPEALRVNLGLGENETIPTGDPERTLVPLARRALARQRQQMLATMVMMGMQRIVIDAGRITASMRFHIDTRSALNEDKASRFDFQHQSRGAASYGAGPWGVSASMTNTIGYVNTQRTQTTEEMNTDLDLSSSVELNFRTDYLPLDRMTGGDRAKLIRANSLNPAEEAKIASRDRQQRRQQATTREGGRRAAANQNTGPRQAPAAKPGDAGTQEAADRARKEAKKRADAKKPEGSGKQPPKNTKGAPDKTKIKPPAAKTPGKSDAKLKNAANEPGKDKKAGTKKAVPGSNPQN